MKRIRSLLFLALALGIGLYSLPSAALQFNYSTRLTLTDCDTADESGFNTGMTALCYDLTAQRDEIWNGSAWVAYLGAGSSSTSPAYMTIVDSAGDSAVDATANAVQTINAPVANTTSLGSAVTGTGAQTAIQGRSPATAMVIGSTSSGAGSATVYIQVSNDNTNFITACTVTLTLSTSVAVDGCGISVPWRYIRMNVNAISGTGAAVTGTLGG